MSGKRSRRKGHKFELDRAKWWRELGWEDCVTSRYASRELDDQKVDLVHTDPFNEQCKRTERIGSIAKILAEMPDDSNYNLVVHKRNGEEPTVTMTLKDFAEIVGLLKGNGAI